MADLTVSQGILVGGAGGAAAGIAVYAVQLIHQKISDHCDSSRIFKWLKENSSDVDGKRYRTTRAIASWNNLTEDRVRFLCSTHKKIYLSTGPQEDRWSIFGREHSPQII